MLLTDSRIGLAKYATSTGTDMGEGANPRFVFSNNQAKDMAEAYCTGCRLMTKSEAIAWGCPSYGDNLKCRLKSGGYWWLADAANANNAYYIHSKGCYANRSVTDNTGVRPAVDIPSTATMSGSGTQLDPYVINTN